MGPALGNKMQQENYDCPQMVIRAGLNQWFLTRCNFVSFPSPQGVFGNVQEHSAVAGNIQCREAGNTTIHPDSTRPPPKRERYGPKCQSVRLGKPALNDDDDDDDMKTMMTTNQSFYSRSDHLGPASLLHSCHSSFKSHRNSPTAFIVQGENRKRGVRGCAEILSNLPKVTDQECGKTGIQTQNFLTPGLLNTRPHCLASLLLTGLAQRLGVLKTFPSGEGVCQ